MTKSKKKKKKRIKTETTRFSSEMFRTRVIYITHTRNYLRTHNGYGFNKTVFRLLDHVGKNKSITAFVWATRMVSTRVCKKIWVSKFSVGGWNSLKLRNNFFEARFFTLVLSASNADKSFTSDCFDSIILCSKHPTRIATESITYVKTSIINVRL